MWQSEAGLRWSRGWRRVVLSVLVGALAPITVGPINVGSWAAALGAGVALAVVAWIFIGLTARG